MSLKPVWIVLASKQDMVAAVHENRAELEAAFAGLKAPDGGNVWIEATFEGQSRLVLILGNSRGDPDSVGWEDDEIELLHELDAWGHANSIESRDPKLAARFVSLLARHAPLAVDNDWDRIVSGEEFLDMTGDEQVAFIMAANRAEDGSETSAEGKG